MVSISAASIASYLGNYVNHFAVLGVTIAAVTTLRVGKRMISIAFRTVRRSFAVDLKENGRWAVITGCTHGLGKNYALQLAEQGLDVVLISRSPQKLSAVVEEINQQYNVEVKVIVADFKQTDIYDNIKRELNGLDIGILVNNVGMLHPMTPAFHCEMTDLEQFSVDLINVNITSCVKMTDIVLPDMLERKRGTIINISSGASIRPLPFFSLYSASKVFVRFFSEALNLEYSSQGVTIQAVIPNMVVSNLSRDFAAASDRRQGLFYPSADVYVRKAIQTIGREAVTGAHWPHEIEQFFTGIVSDSTLRKVLLEQRNQMVELSKKA